MDPPRRRWAQIAIAVVGVLLVAVVVAVALNLGGGVRPTADDPSPSPSGSPAEPDPSVAESPAPSDAPSLAYEPPPGVLPPGARVIVNEPIDLRAAATHDAEVTWRLTAGREMTINGPLIVDGERWYTLSSFDENDPVDGFAALDPAGDQVSVAPVTCPAGEPSIATLAPLRSWERLACNGDREIVLEGHEVVGFGGFRPGIYTPDWLNGFLGAFAIADPDDRNHYLFVRVAPDGPDITRPQPTGEMGSALLRVTGHFSDPASRTCTVTDLPIGAAIPDRTADLEPIAAELACRGEFVVTAFEVVDEGTGEAPRLAELEVGSVVAPVVDGVTLREEPGMGAARIGTLGLGSQNIVIEGPVEADGYAWYRFSAVGLPPASGCIAGPVPEDPLSCPVWFGWAAAGDPDDGTAWFVSTDVACPDPDTEALEFLGLPFRLPLACYGDDEITFTAFYPELPDDAGLGGACSADPGVAWLYCINIDYDEVWAAEEYLGPAKRLFVDPAGGVDLPERGQWLRITGHHDDPAAADCEDANQDVGLYPDDDVAVLSCRTSFVVTAVEVTAAP